MNLSLLLNSARLCIEHDARKVNQVQPRGPDFFRFPSPLAGEGLGVRGRLHASLTIDCHCNRKLFTPHPRPLSHKGRGENHANTNAKIASAAFCRSTSCKFACSLAILIASCNFFTRASRAFFRSAEIEPL